LRKTLQTQTILIVVVVVVVVVVSHICIVQCSDREKSTTHLYCGDLHPRATLGEQLRVFEDKETKGTEQASAILSSIVTVVRF